MSFVPILMQAKFLRHIPTPLVVTYVLVAAIMAVMLLIRFILKTKTRQSAGGTSVVLLIMFFPLAAISMVWPITLPFIAVILWKENQTAGESKNAKRGFLPIIRD